MTNKSVGYIRARVIDCSAAEELKHDLAVPFLTGKFHKKDKRNSVFRSSTKRNCGFPYLRFKSSNASKSGKLFLKMPWFLERDLFMLKRRESSCLH